MEASTINTLQSDHIIKALCNTLMHSLWQGILLAILTGAIILFTKKASAAYRYNMLIGALTLFAGGVLFTFLWQLRQPGLHVIQQAGYPLTTTPVNITAAGPVVHYAIKTNIADLVVNYFNAHYNVIVLLWFLIICGKSVQMAVGLHGVFRLKRTKVFAVSENWEKKLLQLAAQLRIKKVIGLMESGIAKVPMVIGHLKPVILIPIGLINSLTVDEVEAILVHELAHIRRRDYLVNLLQGFMEIVFFFNPAVLWVSALIKTERENCCDDLALSQNNNKVNYIRALVSCEEYQSSVPAYAMAFPGGKHTLLDRVKRMAANRNHSLNMFEKTVLAVCLVVLGLGVSAFTAGENIKKALRSVAAVIQHDVKAQPVNNIKVVNNDTTGKKQAATINSTAALLNQFQPPALSAIDSGKQAGLSSLITHKIDSLRGNEGTTNSPLDLLAKLDTNKRAFKTFHEIGQELYREHIIVDTNHVNISLNEQELIVNGVRMPEDLHDRIYRQFGNGDSAGNYSSSYENKGGNPYGSGRNYSLADTNGHGLYGGQNGYGAGQQRKIIDQMEREGLINTRKGLSFSLTDKKFVINGFVQSDEVFQRYRQEYMPAKAGDTRNWNYHNVTGNYSDADSYHNPEAYYEARAKEQHRLEAERDKKLVADLLQDGLITDPNNVTFTLTDKKLTINGKKQSDETYKKYKDKYKPNNTGSGWSWTYSHHE